MATIGNSFFWLFLKNLLLWHFYRGPSIDASNKVLVYLAKRFQRRIFRNQPITKQELPVAAMFINRSGRNEQFYRGPSIDASYQVLVHLAKRFQRIRFV
jgi:hypothetical protein